MTVSVPQGRERDWERIVRAARTPAAIQMTIRTATLLLFVVQADLEFVAIGMVEDWLKGLATNSLPSFTVGTNAQPSQEV